MERFRNILFSPADYAVILSKEKFSSPPKFSVISYKFSRTGLKVFNLTEETLSGTLWNKIGDEKDLE